MNVHNIEIMTTRMHSSRMRTDRCSPPPLPPWGTDLPLKGNPPSLETDFPEGTWSETGSDIIPPSPPVNRQTVLVAR